MFRNSRSYHHKNRELHPWQRVWLCVVLCSIEQHTTIIICTTVLCLLSLIWRQTCISVSIISWLDIVDCTEHPVAAGGTPSSSQQMMCCPQRLNPPWAKVFEMAGTYVQHGSACRDMQKAKQPQLRAGRWEAAVKGSCPSHHCPAASPWWWPAPTFHWCSHHRALDHSAFSALLQQLSSHCRSAVVNQENWGERVESQGPAQAWPSASAGEQCSPLAAVLQQEPVPAEVLAPFPWRWHRHISRLFLSYCTVTPGLLLH